jgi:hypothetical protein
MSRGRLMAGGAALLLAGPVAGALAPVAAAAPPDDDLASVRLLIGVELLCADFYTRAVASKRVRDAHPLARALANERQHLAALSDTLSAAGQTPATADDFDFAYPSGAFASKHTIAQLGTKVETLALGAYLGAVVAFETPSLRELAARIAASEAEHASVLARLAGRSPVGLSFPIPLTIDQASNALDAFTS